MPRLTAEQALEVSHQLSAEVKQRQTQRTPYECDDSWRSHDKIGNTLDEINEIRAYGHPLPKQDEGTSAGFHKFRDYIYEYPLGFLFPQYLSSGVRRKPEEKESTSVALQVMSLLPEILVEDCYASGRPEVVHKMHGKGFIMDSKEDMVEVFFPDLYPRSLTKNYGASFKWVKRENLL